MKNVDKFFKKYVILVYKKGKLHGGFPMLVRKCISLKKYNNLAKYAKVDDSYYKYRRGTNYCVTLYCELEENETKEDPLNDVLEQYKVQRTGFEKYNELNGKRLYMFELEGACEEESDNKAAIAKVAKFAGKRVFNAEVGEFLELRVRALKDDEQ